MTVHRNKERCVKMQALAYVGYFEIDAAVKEQAVKFLDQIGMDLASARIIY